MVEEGEFREVKVPTAGKLVKQEKALEPFHAGIAKNIAAASDFANQLGLPPEAKCSVLRSAEAAIRLKSIVDRQRRLPEEQRKQLVAVAGGALSSTGLGQIDAMVRDLGVPYDCFSMIEGKPYIKADGIRALLHSDPRIFKSKTTEIIHEEWKDDNYIVGCKTRIDFWSGGYVEAIGYADKLEIQARRRNSAAPPSFVAMIAETRSERRATRSAISLPLGVAEDVEEGREVQEVITIQPAAPAAIPLRNGVPENKGQLLAAALNKYQLKLGDLLKKLEVTSLDAVTDIPAAWKKLEEVMAK